MPGTDDLSGSVALVTGGGRGIGLSIARELTGAGARVAVSARTRGQLEHAAAEIGALAVVGDVSKAEDVAEMVGETERTLGPIDLLVANAGIGGSDAATVDTSPEDWWRVFEVNVLGTYLCCRAVLPGMLARGEGRIVIIGSGASYLPIRAGGLGNNYGPSKAAVGRFAEYLAAEVGPKGVSVFLISPGLVQTEMTESFGPNAPWTPPELAPATRSGSRLGSRRPPRGPVPPRRARRHRGVDSPCGARSSRNDLNAIRLRR